MNHELRMGYCCHETLSNLLLLQQCTTQKSPLFRYFEIYLDRKDYSTRRYLELDVPCYTQWLLCTPAVFGVRQASVYECLKWVQHCPPLP